MCVVRGRACVLDKSSDLSVCAEGLPPKCDAWARLRVSRRPHTTQGIHVHISIQHRLEGPGSWERCGGTCAQVALSEIAQGTTSAKHYDGCRPDSSVMCSVPCSMRSRRHEGIARGVHGSPDVAKQLFQECYRAEHATIECLSPPWSGNLPTVTSPNGEPNTDVLGGATGKIRESGLCAALWGAPGPEEGSGGRAGAHNHRICAFAGLLPFSAPAERFPSRREISQTLRARQRAAS